MILFLFIISMGVIPISSFYAIRHFNKPRDKDIENLKNIRNTNADLDRKIKQLHTR